MSSSSFKYAPTDLSGYDVPAKSFGFHGLSPTLAANCQPPEAEYMSNVLFHITQGPKGIMMDQNNPYGGAYYLDLPEGVQESTLSLPVQPLQNTEDQSGIGKNPYLIV